MPYVLEMTGFNPLAHGTETNYQRYETKEEAIIFFEKVVSNYPSIYTFKLYESKEIDGLPFQLQEQAKERFSAKYLLRLEKEEMLKLLNYKE